MRVVIEEFGGGIEHRQEARVTRSYSFASGFGQMLRRELRSG